MCAQVCAQYEFAWYLRRLEQGVGSHGTGVREVISHLVGQPSGPVREVLLTTESSLAPVCKFLSAVHPWAPRKWAVMTGLISRALAVGPGKSFVGY